MKTSHLHDVWSSPDNSRLLSKQFSFRLPVHIAAKIGALGELYPQKNRTQIVADLLSAALDDLEKNLPYMAVPANESDQKFEDDLAHHENRESDRLFQMGGIRARFRDCANRHYVELEKELGNESPVTLFENLIGTKDYIEGLSK